MNLNDIEQLIVKGELTQALLALKEHIKENPQSEEAYCLQGAIFRKQENWQMALNSFKKAVEINPNSPAKISIELINDILDFFYSDVVNP